MSKFGMHGKFLAQPGQRDALAAFLLKAAAGLQDVEDCLLYIVNVSPTEADAVWVSEVWTSKEAHRAFISTDEFKAGVALGMPLIAGMGERIEVVPMGGKGCNSEHE
jgi:quinol monooxygenase YgiN